MEDIKQKGVINKYILTRTDGRAVDPGAELFCLRLDDQTKDKHHLYACRKAVVKYAVSIEPYLPVLAEDIMRRWGWKTVAMWLVEECMYDQGWVDRWNPWNVSSLDPEWVSKIAKAAKMFFEPRLQMIDDEQIRYIANGGDDTRAEYKDNKAFLELDEVLNNYFNR